MTLDWNMSDDNIHFVEDLEERENASLAITTMACYETGCAGFPISIW